MESDPTGKANGSADQESLQLAEKDTNGESTANAETHIVTKEGKEDGKKEKEKEKEPPAPTVPYYKLFSYADPLDFVLMIIGSIGSIIHGAALPIFLLFFGKLINSLAMQDLSSVATYCLYFVYLGLAVWFGAWLEVSCWMTTGERQTGRIRERYLAAVLKQEIAFFDTDASAGEIVSRVSSDVLLIQDAISEKVGNFMHFFATFITGFVIGFSNVWQLSLVTLGVMPLIVICGGMYAIVLTGLTSKSQEAYADAGKVAEQAISQVRTVYSFSAEGRTVTQYMKALEETLKLGIQGGLYKGLGMGGVFGVMFCAWALLFWYASWLVKWGITNGGQALTTIFSVLIGALSLGQAMPNVQAFAKGQAAAYTVFNTINRKALINADDDSGEKPQECQGLIELRDVVFSYPARPDAPIFQGFSITVSPGQTVALVGGSGSGKSTVIALIERFYDPLSGTVLLDGRDIRSLNLKWMRSHFGLVSQEPALFDTSIKNNIMYGKEGATMEEVEAAAKAANAHNFVSALPNGYDTQVGERGTQMSGGQKQRIAIARALLRNPAVLLLDEATSALDAESEKVVQEALDSIMGGRTTIVVAHRLSTIRNASSIAVVSKGKLVEQGTHEELMQIAEQKGTGEYASLVKMQTMAASTGDSAASAPAKETKSIQLQASALSEGGKSTDAADLVDPEEEKAHAGERNKGSWSRLFKLSLPELPYTVVACIGAAVAGCLNPLFANFLITVITAYYNPDVAAMQQTVNKWAIVFACLGVVSISSYTVQHYFFGVAGEHLVKRVRELMLAAILRNEISWFDKPENSSGAIAARLSSDATLVKAAITDRISVIVQNVSLITVAFVIAFILNWRMSLVIIATFPLLIIASSAQQMFLKGFAGDQEKAHESASKIASEAVGNIRTVAALHMEDRVLALFNAQLAAPLRRSILRGQISGIIFGLTQFVMNAAFGLGLWYGSTLIPDNATFEQVIKVFMILIITSFAISETLTLAPDIAKGGFAIRSVFNVLDRVPEMIPDDPAGATGEGLEGAIELKHVKFAYPTRPDVLIFQDFSLKVPVGKTVALVGSSGSGKSSVIALVERFYDPMAGKVTIDGKDVKDFNLRSLRTHIGLVSQEPALFATTIRGNILYGRESASEAEVIEAAKAANAFNFVSGLPDGLDTQVGERGTQLSGGQKQRIAIARAVLKNPAILLLDEATSALDAESEKIVQDALDRLMVGRSTVVIAHRLSTIKDADIIAVVQQGKIIEQGTHDSLISQTGGAYYSLVNLQRK